jgi:4-hydroxy-tetrahydrodipicolinate reductase
MTKIILCGCGGRMGRAITESANMSKDLKIVAGVDINAGNIGSICSFPVYSSINEVECTADVIIDFSHHSALLSLIDYSIAHNTPLVVATTGHTDEEKAMMLAASEKTAIFFSRNMSIGINLLIDLCKKASATLGLDFDIEIIEKHHHNKLDAPSGTAMMIAETLKEERASECNTEFVYDRHNVRKQREINEIGIHAVRGGTIVGEHDVIFAGNNEIITLSHSATSREIFATGALKAAAFMVGKTSGMYSMSDVIESKK